jgi:hypothetical protein
MFDVVDFVIIIVLCCVFIFFIIFFARGHKQDKSGENVKTVAVEGDIQPIFYTEDIYQITNSNNKAEVNGSELENTQVLGISEEQMELGVVTSVDAGNDDEEDGFFTYQPEEENEDGNNDENGGSEEVLDPPRTWDDFLKGRDKLEEVPPESPELLAAFFQKNKSTAQTSVKDMIVRVREELVNAPLTDEEFKKKFFSRLYEDNDGRDEEK